LRQVQKAISYQLGSQTVTVTGTVYRYAAPSVTPTVNLGSVHVGDAFGTQPLTVINSAASDGYSETLDAVFSGTTGLTTTNGGSIGLLGPTGTNTTSMVVGLGGSANTGTVGVKSGTATVGLTSDGTGTSGLTNTGLTPQSVNITGTVYAYAAASATSTVDFGRIHAGGTFGTQALAVSNTAASGSYTETLGAAFGTPSSGLTASGSISGLAGGSGNSSSMVVGISDNTAGSKSGTVALNLTSQALSGSGLSNTALTSQTVTVNGFAYSGLGVWNSTTGGSWGNNTNDYGRWTTAGGVPGLDGALSANDTATFGSAITAPATISLNGANPSLKSVTFNSSYAYTLAAGTGGTLTLNGNGSAATVSATGAADTISAPVVLATNASITTTNLTDRLTLSGSVTGSGTGISKLGAGELVVSGTASYTGATVVSVGTLAVAAGGRIDGTSGVTVAAGSTLLVDGTLKTAGGTGAVAVSGTLTGSGTVNAPVTIENGGVLAPGDGIGTLTVDGNAVWNPGGAYQWEMDQVDSGSISQDSLQGSQFDFTRITGNLDLRGLDATNKFIIDMTAILANPTGWNNGAAKHSWTIASTQGGILLPSGVTDINTLFSITNNHLDTSGMAAANPYFYLSQVNGDIMLNYVPEPGTLGLLALGALALLGRRRNRK
jgi:hypothetical protein